MSRSPLARRPGRSGRLGLVGRVRLVGLWATRRLARRTGIVRLRAARRLTRRGPLGRIRRVGLLGRGRLRRGGGMWGGIGERHKVSRSCVQGCAFSAEQSIFRNVLSPVNALREALHEAYVPALSWAVTMRGRPAQSRCSLTRTYPCCRSRRRTARPCSACVSRTSHRSAISRGRAARARAR